MKFLMENHDNAVDGILRHFFQGEELSATHEEILHRVDFAYDKIVDGLYSHSQIAKLIRRKFDVSQGTSENDIQRAKIIYGELRSIRVDAQLVIELQLAERILTLAFKKGDPKSAAAAQRNKLEILFRMAEMEKIIDPRKFEQHHNYLVVILGKGAETEETMRLDLNHVEKIPLAERIRIMTELNEHKDELAEMEIIQ